MYQILAFIFIVAPAIILYHSLNKRGIRYRQIIKYFSDGLKRHFTGLTKIRKNELIKWIYHLKHFLYYITIAQVMILMLTGFIPVIFLGQHIFGIFLLIHALITPFFCVSVALLVLLSANQNLFTKDDLDLLLSSKGIRIKGNQSSLLTQKISFWVFALFSIPAILSIILSMYPLFGTEGQYYLLTIHRSSVFVISIAVLAHSYCLLTSVAQNDQCEM